SRVGLEHEVERRLELALERGPADLGRYVIAPAAAGPVRIGHVARRLLEVGHEAAPLEELREDVGDALAREGHAAQLGDRVGPVLDEDPLEEALGPRGPDILRECRTLGQRRRADELVQEQPAQRLGRARVASEEGALDYLG